MTISRMTPTRIQIHEGTFMVGLLPARGGPKPRPVVVRIAPCDLGIRVPAVRLTL